MKKQDVTAVSGQAFSGYTLQYGAETSGLYRAVSAVTVDGRKIESAPYSFFVKPFTPESNPRPANIQLLRALAGESKGRFCEATEVNQVLSAITVMTTEEQHLTYGSLWDHWVVIACLMALIAVEWIIRKTRNMA